MAEELPRGSYAMKYVCMYDTQMHFTTLFGGLCQTANAAYS